MSDSLLSDGLILLSLYSLYFLYYGVYGYWVSYRMDIKKGYYLLYESVYPMYCLIDYYPLNLILYYLSYWYH